MSNKRMPKKVAPKVEDELSDDARSEVSTVSDTISVSSDNSNDENIEEGEYIVDDEEDVETTSSSDENDVYQETDVESEKDLKEGDIRDEDDCEYEQEYVQTKLPHVQVPADQRSTRNVLTKYERVRILGTRAKQISVGAPVYVKGVEGKTPSEIAELELQHGLIPSIIKRTLPDNSYEIWKISELKLS